MVEMPIYNETMTDICQRQMDVSTLSTQVVHVKKKTFLATWNVPTHYQYGRLDQVMKEMIKYKIDILMLEQALIGWKPINESINTARFQKIHAKFTIIQAHAPTMEADNYKKDNFYKVLQNVINGIPGHDNKLLMGDLNVQIDKFRHCHRPP